MFCWVDMRQALAARRERNANKPSGGTGDKPSGGTGEDGDIVAGAVWEEERELWRDLMYTYRVLITPGVMCVTQ